MKSSESTRIPAESMLSVWDGVSIIVGIVVGVSIFKSPPMVFSSVTGPWQMMGVWLAGGVLSFIGALCYAELTTAYPYSGGDYVYLTKAYGSFVGFLFGWAQLIAILTGSIGAMAYVFASYAGSLWSLEGDLWMAGLATGAVAVLSVLNLLGVVVGKRVQNLLTIAKLAGLGAIVICGMALGGGASLVRAEAIEKPALGLAMIFVLYTYGGWNDAAFVAAEVRDQRRNLPRVLLMGTALITVVYLIVNLSYLWALGFDGVCTSEAPAADVLANSVGPWGSKIISVLVMVSALGAVNGMILTGSRVYASLGADHRIFAALAYWHPRWRAPIWSLLASAAVAITMILVVGTEAGRTALDKSFLAVKLNPLPWDRFHGGFDTLVAGTAPVFWLFFLLTGVSLFILRWKDGGTERPFRVPLFPITPLIFCGVCVYMLYSSLTYARQLALLGVVPLVVGAPLYWLSRRAPSADESDSE